MEQLTDRAIVLRVVPFEDRHRIVTALTEGHGRISALARNSTQSRRFGGALDLFAASEWKFTLRAEQHELFTLSEARTLKSHEGFRARFGALAMASLFNEFMLRVAPEREACLDLFKLHANALAALEEWPADPPPLSMLNGYLAKLLQWSGNQPQLQCCRGCEKPLQSLWEGETDGVELTVLVEDAGWVCDGCRSTGLSHLQSRGTGLEPLRVGAGAMADFYLSLVTPIRQIATTAHASDDEHRRLFRVLEALFIFHLPGFDRIPLNSLRFLGLESSWQPAPDFRR